MAPKHLLTRQYEDLFRVLHGETVELVAHDRSEIDMTESGDPIGQVADCLLNIEMELRQLGCGVRATTGRGFPECPAVLHDTLEFTQWLQFVFVARMKVIIENDHPLPSASGIAPMAEEHFRGRAESGNRLVRELEAIDRLLSEG